MTRDEQVIWSAGFFDGEGCVFATTASTKRGGWYLGIYVVQRNRRCLDLLQELFDCGSVRSQKVNTQVAKNRQMHRWTVYGTSAVSVLREMLPFLVEKREQALLGIEFVEAKTGYHLTEAEVARRIEIIETLKRLRREE